MRRALATLALLLASSCGDTGQPTISRPAFAVGAAPKMVSVGSWDVSLVEARVGVGPFTFCASRASSSELCPAALAEVASTAAIDALSPALQPIGRLEGFVGTVRSAGFGYAFTWLETQPAPRPSRNAPLGHSARVRGVATSKNKTPVTSFEFVADVDVIPTSQATHAVTATNLEGRIDEGTSRLEVRLDPHEWVAQIDFDELAALGKNPVRIEPKTRAWNALVVGMTSLAPPRFDWPRSP